MTWCGVRVFDSTPAGHAADVASSPTASIEMKYAGAPAWTATDGIAAVSPGRTTAFLPVDLSTTATAPLSGNAGAIGERFALRPDLDLVALSRKFYRTHGDAYNQLIIWTDAVMTPEDAFSFEVTVANEIAGIGLDVFNRRASSAAAADCAASCRWTRSSKFPADPTTRSSSARTARCR